MHKVTLTLDLELSSMTKEEIREQLEQAVQHIMGEGLVTGETAGEVESYSHKVTVAEIADPDNDEFVCEECCGVFDIEDSCKTEGKYLCPDCKADLCDPPA